MNLVEPAKDLCIGTKDFQALGPEPVTAFGNPVFYHRLNKIDSSLLTAWLAPKKKLYVYPHHSLLYVCTFVLTSLQQAIFTTSQSTVVGSRARSTKVFTFEWHRRRRHNQTVVAKAGQYFSSFLLLLMLTKRFGETVEWIVHGFA